MSSQFCQTRYNSLPEAVRRACRPLNKHILFLSLIILFTAVLNVSAGEKNGEDETIFSYKRYYLNPGVPLELGDKERLTREIGRFRQYFTDGINAFSSGNMTGSREDLFAARAIWPEYFNTDLLIALSYENDGDVKEGAKFYKSYLNKLKDFHKNKYRISAPLISSFSSGEVAEYAKAYELVRGRMAGYGIDIDKVSPAVVLPEFLAPSIAAAIILCVYLFFRCYLLPYWRRRRRIANPPQGFWVCKKCVTDNTLLDKECGKCGNPPNKRENITSERCGTV